ncbi:MAG: hypothetical protein WD768_07610 [Phycisphaeraceae bacterium]
MKTIETIHQAGSDKLLRLSIPVAEEGRYRVTVLVRPEAGEQTEYVRDAKGWPEGFFENVIGAWRGDLERGDQGEYESRESL